MKKKGTRYIGVILLLVMLVAMFALMLTTNKDDEPIQKITGAATTSTDYSKKFSYYQPKDESDAWSKMADVQREININYKDGKVIDPKYDTYLVNIRHQYKEYLNKIGVNIDMEYGIDKDFPKKDSESYPKYYTRMAEESKSETRTTKITYSTYELSAGDSPRDVARNLGLDEDEWRNVEVEVSPGKWVKYGDLSVEERMKLPVGTEMRTPMQEKDEEEDEVKEEEEEEDGEKDKEKPEKVTEIGIYTVDENNIVYLENAPIGTLDQETKLVELSIDHIELKGKFYDPISGKIYSKNDPKDENVLFTNTKVYENGNFRVTQKVDGKSKDRYFIIDRITGKPVETNRKINVMYLNGAYLHEENGELKFVNAADVELPGVTPDGRGGWYDDKGNHFIGDVEGTVFNKKEWTFYTDSDYDGDIDDMDAGIKYDSCTHYKNQLVCEKDDKVYDCANYKCSKDPIDEETQKDMGAYWMLRTGNILGTVEEFTSGYSGISLLYDEPMFEFDPWMSNVLGGIDGWTSLICQHKTSDSNNYGAAFSQTMEGAYAHIEGERLKTYQFENSPPTILYFYKISFEVAGGDSCDIKFRVTIGNHISKYLFKDSVTGEPFIFYANQSAEPISYAGNKMIFAQSTTDYNKLCIDFVNIEPRNCLIGVDKDEDLCATIRDAGERSIDISDPCENSLNSLFVPLCWFGGGKGEGIGGLLTDDEEVDETTPGSPVLDI